jgi:large repetitive protein
MSVRDDPVPFMATAGSGLPVMVQAAGPCVVVGTQVRPTGAGTCTLSATQAGDDEWAPATPVTAEIAIERASQSITVVPLEDAVFGTGPIAIDAGSTSGLEVSLSTEGPCAISAGTELIFTGAGVCTVIVAQTGDEDWAPADEVRRIVRVARASQQISVGELGPLQLGQPSLSLSVAASSGLPVMLRAEGPCEVADGQVRPTGAGTCVLTASQAGNDDWNPATPVRRALIIERAAQTILVQPLADLVYGEGPIPVPATATSGLPVAFEAEGPCEVADGHVRPTGAGTCTLTATQAGDSEWAPADPVSRELAVERATQTIDVELPEGVVYGVAPIPLSATATSGLPVNLGAEGPCSIDEDGLTVTEAGTCLLTAAQAGSQDWAPAIPVRRELTIARARQAVTFGPLDGMVVGADGRELEARSTSGLPVVFRTQGPCEIADGSVRPTGAGLCAVTAAQPGDARFDAAEDVQRVFRITRKSQHITFPRMDDQRIDAPAAQPSAVASSGLAVTYVARGACSLDEDGHLVLTETGTCRLTAFQMGDGAWAPADEVSRAFTVGAPASGSSPAPSGASDQAGALGVIVGRITQRWRWDELDRSTVAGPGKVDG